MLQLVYGIVIGMLIGAILTLVITRRLKKSCQTKIIIKWKGTTEESALLPELVTVEYAGQHILFEDGNISVRCDGCESGLRGGYNFCCNCGSDLRRKDITARRPKVPKVEGKNHYANHIIRKMEIPEFAKPSSFCEIWNDCKLRLLSGGCLPDTICVHRVKHPRRPNMPPVMHW